jgi:hypothetical protein
MPLLGRLLKELIHTRNEMSLRPRNPLREQRAMLRKLLRQAQFTQFGKAHRFSDLALLPNPTKAFRDTVPMFDYDKIFNTWWHRALEGEADVCWTGPVKFFALSSGTSGSASKRIPITNDMIRAIRRASLKQILAMSNFNFSVEAYEKGILMLGGSTDLKNKGPYFEGDLSGINASKIPTWFQAFYKPGRNIARESDWDRKLDEIARKAPTWDIAHICGIPAWNQLMLERIIAMHGARNIHDVWPNLTSFVHGGVAFEPYRKSFEKLLGKPITYIDTYLASEGFVAYQDRPNTKGMRLITNNGIYYEFVPFNEQNFDDDGNLKPDAKALALSHVDDKTDYAILMSTCAGAWRYLIGDTVRFTDLERYEIAITGRTKHFLSLCGEHMSVDNMNDAIAFVANELNIGIREFTVVGKPSGNLFTHHWYIGADNGLVDTNAVKVLLDQRLKDINDDYATERLHALKDIAVDVLPAHLFYEWHESHGKLGGQNKFPRVLKGDKLRDWEAFLQQKHFAS